jgi:hypothetical protein
MEEWEPYAVEISRPKIMGVLVAASGAGSLVYKLCGIDVLVAMYALHEDEGECAAGIQTLRDVYPALPLHPEQKSIFTLRFNLK